MAIRECDCKEFQDSGHTDECNKHYDPARFVGVEAMPVTKPTDGSTRLADVTSGIINPSRDSDV